MLFILIVHVALLNVEDNSLRYLCQTQLDSLLAVELPKNEFLLIFSGELEIVQVAQKNRIYCSICTM